jgi:hypothetical protein
VARAVFIGTVRAVENNTVRADGGLDVVVGQKAWVTVEKTFKGEVSGELLFRSYGSSCDPTYREGQQWLFYGYFNEKEKAWQIGACDRSTLLNNANDDLRYLNALPASAKTTRISGRVEQYGEDPEKGLSLVKHIIGAKVTISGPKNFEVFTDSSGIYELYDAPPGLYEISVEIPLGMELKSSSFYGTKVVDIKEWPDGRRGLWLRLKLEEKGCVSRDFSLSTDNAISGKVIGADGKPMPRVCLEVISANAPKISSWRTSTIFGCTEADGTYTLKQMPPGDYLLVANYHNKISSDEPFGAVYYPGTFDRKKATVITMALGDRRTAHDITIPSQFPTHILSGVLLFADGKPVPDGFVQFDAVDVAEGYDGETHTSVDAQGRFELPVLAGFKGSLRGYVFTYEGDLDCPRLDEILKTSGRRAPEISTERLPMEINSDKPNLELRLPFASCVKAKEP